MKIVVFNNASDDGTEELLREFKEKYGDILDYNSGTVHVKCTESFFSAFGLPKSEWLWMFGDDDILATNGLKTVISTIKNREVEFIHAAEISRFNGEARTYYSTTMDLCCGFGFIEMTGLFITGNICKTHKFQDVMKIEGDLAQLRTTR